MTQPLYPEAIIPGVSFGNQVIVLHVKPLGIGSASPVGSPSVVQLITPDGIDTGEAVGDSTVTLGDPRLHPTGIDTGEAFGTPRVGGILPDTAGTGETFGTAALTTGPVTLYPVGINSRQFVPIKASLLKGLVFTGFKLRGSNPTNGANGVYTQAGGDTTIGWGHKSLLSNVAVK